MRIVFLLSLLQISCTKSMDAEVFITEIKMLNQGINNPSEFMTFEPDYVELNTGNAVMFKLTDRGHGSKSIVVPQDALHWNSGLDNELLIILKNEGYYLYECKPHTKMGMIGVVKIGNASNKNKTEVLKKLSEILEITTMNKKRLRKIIRTIESDI